MSAYGYCPKCGAMGLTRERRPNGNDRCTAGHTYPSRDAANGPLPTVEAPGKLASGESVESLTEYRSRVDCACEGLAMTLGDIGITEAHDDDKLIEIASAKLKMLFDMLLAAGLNENLLKAAVRG